MWKPGDSVCPSYENRHQEIGGGSAFRAEVRELHDQAAGLMSPPAAGLVGELVSPLVGLSACPLETGGPKTLLAEVQAASWSGWLAKRKVKKPSSPLTI